jgi:D-tyrosyl-tRNA(Tyr) deacylase
MRVLIQRASKASVIIEGKIYSKIDQGVVVLVGIENEDNQEDIDFLVKKIINLRIFDDKQGVMNLSLLDTNGEILVISQFTLYAMTKKGNRPSYIKAAPPKIAIPLYNRFIEELKTSISKEIKTGIFGAHMEVELVNHGPVTIWIDSKNRE